MATTNLGLDIINSSDYVSPTPINNNMEKLDKLGIDYVVEQGTSGEWWYRKWKSGRAECGIDFKQFGEITSWTQSGIGYITSELSFGAYPFSFAARPYTSIAFEGDLNYATRGSFCVPKHSTSTTLSPSFFIVDWGNQAMKPMCGIYVCGRYK